MMQPMKDLKITFYAKLVFCITFSLLFLLAFILSVLFPTVFFIEVPTGITLSVIVMIFSLIELYLLYVLITCLKDLKNVLKNHFEVITGRVIRYARNQADTGRQLNNYPIIQEVNSDKTIRLLVNKGTEINGTYTFYYLKHTKIGIVKTND